MDQDTKQDNKWPSTSLEGDKFWCAVTGDGSLPIVTAKHTDIGTIRRISELVDSLNIPLQINPDGTTKWIIGTDEKDAKGNCKNVVSQKQLQEAVNGDYVELLPCTIAKKRTRYIYVNDIVPLDASHNPFATAVYKRSPLSGPIVLMPNRRRD